MTKLAELEIPVLEGGYINLTEAAERLGYTRSYMYKKASRFGEPGGFTTIRRIGSQASYVIQESEVEDLLTRALEKPAEPVVEEVVEKPKRKSRAKKEKPVEETIVDTEASDTTDTTDYVVPEDPAIHEIEPEPAPVTLEEPEPAPVNDDAQELSIEEILAQI
jgi:predicted DNA-binding transcriptional regulator AlpA